MAWKIRCQDTSLKRGVWRPGNFLILSDLPQIMAYRIRARGQSNCVFLSCLSKNCLSTVRTVSLSILVPKFYGTRRIDLYSRTRFSTVIRESRSSQDESVCILEAGFPRYYENGLIFKNPKFLDTRRIDSYSRFWYSTVREISLGILDPHYILSGVLGKATNSPDNSAPSY